jgi:hypothetical protein
MDNNFSAYPKMEGCHCQKATMIVAPIIDKNDVTHVLPPLLKMSWS